MAKCKITVIKKIANQDLIEEYYAFEVPKESDGTCPNLKIGQEFFYTPGDPVPQGFCPWAWADINRDVEALCAGANFDWEKYKGTQIACCTDGMRPVVFKIERVD